jgi:hypothetical protein
VIALNHSILTALYATTKFRAKFALFLAFNLIHAKNCIIGLSDDGNYATYRGKDNEGKTKKAFAEELAKKMAEETTSQHRTAAQVQSKIDSTATQWRAAHEWAQATGAGLKERDLQENTTTFDDAVKKRCPHYFLLLNTRRLEMEQKSMELDHKRLEIGNDSDRIALKDKLVDTYEKYKAKKYTKEQIVCLVPQLKEVNTIEFSHLFGVVLLALSF